MGGSYKYGELTTEQVLYKQLHENHDTIPDNVQAQAQPCTSQGIWIKTFRAHSEAQSERQVQSKRRGTHTCWI